eukprot:1775846-Amphidinium_carterae.1
MQTGPYHGGTRATAGTSFFSLCAGASKLPSPIALVVEECGNGDIPFAWDFRAMRASLLAGGKAEGVSRGVWQCVKESGSL